jgi:hypothetical protein
MVYLELHTKVLCVRFGSGESKITSGLQKWFRHPIFPIILIPR